MYFTIRNLNQDDDLTALELFPEDIRNKYEIYEWKHASAALKGDFPNEWEDIIKVLSGFRLRKSDIIAPGKNKSPIASALDQQFFTRGWEEKAFETKVVVDQKEIESPTHKIDCFKNRIALEIEWNNKDPFYDRDLNNFRLLFDLRAISVGVIITRADHLQKIFNNLGKGSSYGASTTHMSKLLPKINGGGGGGCPILAFGITDEIYIED
mgnify:CR=1 FL=1